MTNEMERIMQDMIVKILTDVGDILAWVKQQQDLERQKILSKGQIIKTMPGSISAFEAVEVANALRIENEKLKADADKWKLLTIQAGKVGLTEADLFKMVTPIQYVESEEITK